MKTIYKYPVRPNHPPSDHAGDGGNPARRHAGEDMFVWALVEPDGRAHTMVEWGIYCTGSFVPTNPGRFVGTVTGVMGSLVFHVFIHNDDALVSIRR